MHNVSFSIGNVLKETRGQCMSVYGMVRLRVASRPSCRHPPLHGSQHRRWPLSPRQPSPCSHTAPETNVGGERKQEPPQSRACCQRGEGTANPLGGVRHAAWEADGFLKHHLKERPTLCCGRPAPRPRAVPGTWAPVSPCQDPKSGKAPSLLASMGHCPAGPGMPMRGGGTT